MGRQERLAAIRRKQGLAGENASYYRYLDKMRRAKQSNWRFNPEVNVVFTLEQFKEQAARLEPYAETFGQSVEDMVLHEQLLVYDESIDQAVMLWKEWPQLVREEPNMTADKFRRKESYYFMRLRSMYPDDGDYDLAMSY